MICIFTSHSTHAANAMINRSRASGSGSVASLAGVFRPLPIIPACRIERTTLAPCWFRFKFINDVSPLLNTFALAGHSMSLWEPNRFPYIYNEPSNNSRRAATRVYLRVHKRASNAVDRLT